MAMVTLINIKKEIGNRLPSFGWLSPSVVKLPWETNLVSSHKADEDDIIQISYYHVYSMQVFLDIF